MIIALPAGTVNIFIWRANINSGPGTVLGVRCQSMDFVASLLLAIYCILLGDSTRNEQTLMCFPKRVRIILSLDEFVIEIGDLNGEKSKHGGNPAHDITM